MADSKIIIEVGVVGDAEVRLKKIGEAAEEASKKSSKGFFNAEQAMSVFLGTLGSQAASAAFNKFVEGIGAVVEFLGDSIEAAAEAEENMNQMRIALQSAGVTSEASAQKFFAFAGALQETTKFSDDAILSAGALIQQIGKLDEEGLEQATVAATNLSAALGIDLQTAAQMVGKAANGEIGTFRRYGIAIKEGADIAETFANTLDTLNSKFGGAAAAQIKTYAGAQAVLNNQFDDFKESIGNIIIQNPVLIKLIAEVGNVFKYLTQVVNDNKDTLSRYLSEGIIGLVSGTQIAIEAIQALREAFLLVTIGYLKYREAVYDNTPFLRLTDSFKQQAAEARNTRMALQENYDTLKRSESLDNFALKLQKVKMEMESMAAAAESGSVRAVQAGQQTFDFVNSKDGERTEKQIAEAAKRAAEEQRIRDQELSNLLSHNELLISEDKFKNEELIRQQYAAALKKAENEGAAQNKINEIKKKGVEFEKQINKDRLTAATDSLNALATLQNAKTKEIAAVGKAAAIAQATIDTYKGATSAASALAGIPIVGPALAAAAAGAFIAAGLFRVAQISGVELATGMTEVPPGFANDTFPARLSSGERVVDAGTNQDLKAFLANSGGQTAILTQIYQRLQQMEMRVNVFIGGRHIVDEVRTGLEQGRTLDVAV